MNLDEFLKVIRKKEKVGIALPKTAENYLLEVAEDGDSNISETIQRIILSNIPGDKLLPPDIQQEIVNVTKNYLCKSDIRDVIFYVGKIKDMSSTSDTFWFLEEILELKSNSLFEKRNLLQILSYSPNSLENIKQKILEDEQIKKLMQDSIKENNNKTRKLNL